MKWHSSFFKAIPLVPNSINFIVFENMQQQFQYRELLNAWLQNQQMEYPYFIFTKDGVELTAKNLNVLTMYGGDVQFFKSKEDAKQLTDLVKFNIENTPSLLATYQELLHAISHGFEQLEFTYEQFAIEFVTNELSFSQILKLTSIEISQEQGRDINILEYRQFLLSSWLHLVHNKNTNVCLYHFPENEITPTQFSEMFEKSKSTPYTTVCLTSNAYFLELVELHNIHLIKATGERYEIELLYEHLKLFQLEGPFELEKLTKKLAIHDFLQDTALLDDKWRTFLESSRF